VNSISRLGYLSQSCCLFPKNRVFSPARCFCDYVFSNFICFPYAYHVQEVAPGLPWRFEGRSPGVFYCPFPPRCIFCFLDSFVCSFFPRSMLLPLMLHPFRKRFSVYSPSDPFPSRFVFPLCFVFGQVCLQKANS